MFMPFLTIYEIRMLFIFTWTDIPEMNPVKYVFKQTIHVNVDHHIFVFSSLSPLLFLVPYLVTGNIVRLIIVWSKITSFVTLKDT